MKAKYRNRGIEAAMLIEGFNAAIKAGFKDVESSWILEDNVMMRRLLETFGGVPYKTYRLYDQGI